MERTLRYAPWRQWIDKFGAHIQEVLLLAFASEKASLRRWHYITASALALRIVAIIFAMCSSSEILAQSPSVVQKSPHVREQDRLIDTLANHNSPPILVDEAGKPCPPLFASNYNWGEQDRVRKAIDSLAKQDGVELWPRLIERFDDKRYSLTCKINGVAANMTIGAVCLTIARHDLAKPFSGLWPTDTPIDGSILTQRGRIVPPMHHDFWSWYNARKGKPLWELQIELGQWGIKTIEEMGIVNNRTNQRDIIQKTQTVIDELQRTKEPIVNKRWPYETNLFTEREAKEIREDYLKRTSTKPASVLKCKEL